MQGWAICLQRIGERKVSGKTEENINLNRLHCSLTFQP